MPRWQTHRALSVILVVVLLLVGLIGIGLRLQSAHHKITLGHDEAVSFVVATCHEDAYQRMLADRSYPYGVAAPAKAWQRFWHVEDKLCFGSIAAGLAHTDVHPPLYFWLLHVWSLIAGVGLSQAVWLNLFFVALTALALFGLGREAFGDAVDAGVLAAVWILSPATIGTSTEARQYDLFALVTVLFVWQVLRVTRPGGRIRPLDAAALAAATTAGELTNYLFVVVIAGAAVVAAVRLLPGDTRRLAAAAGSVIAGSLLFVAIHPSFLHSFEIQARRTGGSGDTGFSRRVDHLLTTLADYALGKTQYGPANGRIVAGVMLVSVAALGVLFLARRRRPAWRARLRGASLAFMAIWIGGSIVVLYLTSVTTGHAMGARYMAQAWPLFAAVPILLLRFAGRLHRPLAALFVGGMLAAGITSAHRVDSANARLSYPGVMAQGHRAILVDTVKRGLLPPALWRVAPDRTVVAASQQALLTDPRPWLRDLDRHSLAYVSSTSLGGTRDRRQQIRRRLLADGRRVRAAGRLTLWDSRNVVGATTERVFAVSQPNMPRTVHRRPRARGFGSRAKAPGATR